MADSQYGLMNILAVQTLFIWAPSLQPKIVHTGDFEQVAEENIQ